LKIGFVGYSGAKFDEKQAQDIIDKIFKEINKLRQTEPIEIVSGATYMGIPAMVYDEASDYDFKTIGVMCKEGYECDLYPCDEIYAVGSDWGDESDTFIGMIDRMYRIGGGKQSLEEVQKAKKKGIPVFEYELPEIKEK
jgi:hypothetical protein